MSNDEVKATLGNVLLAFQICLALWQILKLTPVGALVKGVMGWLLRPLGLSPTYTRLKCLPGHVFKTVDYFFVFERPVCAQVRDRCDDDEIRFVYLGKRFHLERRGTEKIMLFVNGKMCYYISDIIWDELAYSLYQHPGHQVFLKNYKEIWERVATGKDLTFEEVLDCLIVDHQTMRSSEGSSLLLPVDLSVSEEKLLKVLNLAGLFLQTKKVYWLIPVLLSLISTVMEFCTPLRIWIYDKINLLFCYAMHVVCDPLPRSIRRQIYSLGKFVENLKPSNDIKLKVTKGNITATITGGAKVHREGELTLLPLFPLEETATQMTFQYDKIDFECSFDAASESCVIRATTFEEFSMVCFNRFQFLCILTLVSSMAKNGSGSLKSYGPNHQVRVRGFMQSVHDYGTAGSSNLSTGVYEMELENVVVN